MATASVPTLALVLVRQIRWKFPQDYLEALEQDGWTPFCFAETGQPVPEPADAADVTILDPAAA